MLNAGSRAKAIKAAQVDYLIFLSLTSSCQE
jgi:hypothetical protein